MLLLLLLLPLVVMVRPSEAAERYRDTGQ